jgi:acyl-coenzyme A thioesterase PaaI-like protein
VDRVECPEYARLERPGGIVNGPALMAAADCAMWLAIKARIGVDNDALTSELNTAFLAPAKGEHVYCTAKILKMGRRRIYGVAECHGKQGNLFSHHTVTYVRAG